MSEYRPRALLAGVALAITGACGSSEGAREVQLGSSLDSGTVVRYEFRVHCGARILGRFNGRWWRATDALEIKTADWYPPGWVLSRDESDVLDVELRYDESSQRIVATYRDTSVTYEPGPSLADWELCA